MIDLVLVAFNAAGLFAGSRLARSEWRGLATDVGALSLLGLTLCFAGAVLGLALFGSGFAVVNFLAHGLFVVFAPTLIVRGVTVVRRRRASGMIGIAVGGGLLVAAGWAFFVEPFRLTVREYAFTSERLHGLDEPIRVVVLADLQTDHVGAFERRVFEKIDELRPDLLLLPGDWVQLRPGPRLDAEREALAALFVELEHRPRFGMFAVDGDVDLASEALAGTDVTILEDELAVLPPETRLQILGLTTRTSRRPIGETVHAARGAFPGLTIVLGHAPDFARPLLDGSEEGLLAVAGHTHGGQVVLPFFGPPLTLCTLPRRFGGGGFFELGKAALCISRGVGMERLCAPQLRFLCPPELVVIELGGRQPRTKSSSASLEHSDSANASLGGTTNASSVRSE